MPDGPLFAADEDDGSFTATGNDYAYGDDEGSSDGDTGVDNGDQNGGAADDGDGGDGGDGDDGENDESPPDAAADSKSEFDDQDVTPVVQCQPGNKKAAAKKTCTAEIAKKNLDACDGGTNAWADAKTAAGKDPTVNVGPTISKMGAETVGSTITIAPTSNCCDMTESLLFELHNVENKDKIQQLANDAYAGNVAREDFTRTSEHREYDGLKRSWETFDKCKKTWGCGPGAKSFADGYKTAKDFDDYYDHFLPDKHKKVYRDWWDDKCKKQFDDKHKKAP